MDRIDRTRLVRRAAALGAAAALAAVASAWMAPPVRASSPPAPADGPAAASASAPAASGSAAAAPAALPAVRSADIPAEPSKEPKSAEWKDGKAVRPHRGALDRCKLTLVREWLRVTCNDWVGATLAAGDREGVKMWVAGERWSEQNPQAVTVILPLRRGRSQVFTLLSLSGGGYDALALGEAGAMSVLWREGQEDPVIVLGIHPG